MNEHLEETISAALDGEPVDLAQLREALNVPEGRQVLAGFLLVRAAASASVGEPDDALKVDVQEVARPRWFMAGPQVPARLAASLAAIVMGGALWFGIATRGVPGERSPAYQARATAESTPARAPVANRATPPAIEQQPTPVKPTRMLQFNGWREGS